MFIPPKYQCDCCNKREFALWTGQPNWDMPNNWVEVNHNHYCLECTKESRICNTRSSGYAKCLYEECKATRKNYYGQF